MYLRTTDDIRLEYLTDAEVLWSGEGAPQAAGWYRDSDGYRTPVHEYATDGRRKVIVTHRYVGPNSSFSVVSTASIEVGEAPREPATTVVSTWSVIKALFASDE